MEIRQLLKYRLKAAKAANAKRSKHQQVKTPCLKFKHMSKCDSSTRRLHKFGTVSSRERSVSKLQHTHLRIVFSEQAMRYSYCILVNSYRKRRNFNVVAKRMLGNNGKWPLSYLICKMPEISTFSYPSVRIQDHFDFQG